MGISLTEALRELRQELYAAQDEGASEQFQFEVEQAELSLEVEFRRDGEGKVKVEVGAWGAKAGVEGGGGLGSTRRQVLTLTLQVRDEARGGQRARIRRTDGGLDDAEDDAVGHDSGVEGAQVRPWEA
ncbi:trypco2 family protein [Streptomyces griseosporeus]|uniref:trypco2 family protein n=1 Tax=Streptomyces griseosporeus TaxID=1910 RepID=UPI001E40B343|nr:trypco2 family protein [Streptomyces griseosporeus]